jgi:hypothetical protein
MVIKSERLRWVENVSRMGDMRNSYHILVGKPNGEYNFGDLRKKSGLN